MNKDGRKHRKKKPEDLVPKHVKDAQARSVARLGGRPPGSTNALDNITAAAVKNLKGFRVQDRYKDNPDVGTIADFTFGRLVEMAGGRFRPRRGPTTLKAIIAVREEITEPVVRESRVSGVLDLGAAVSEAQKRLIK